MNRYCRCKTVSRFWIYNWRRFNSFLPECQEEQPTDWLNSCHILVIFVDTGSLSWFSPRVNSLVLYLVSHDVGCIVSFMAWKSQLEIKIIRKFHSAVLGELQLKSSSTAFALWVSGKERFYEQTRCIMATNLNFINRRFIFQTQFRFGL